MKNQKSVQPPAECNKPAIEGSMQQWLDQAQNSSDVRDRIAVVDGISRGVFGSLHFGPVESPEPENYDADNDEFRHAA